MKIHLYFNELDRRHRKLRENRAMTVRGMDIHITCYSGRLYVTWPEGHERVLLAGQHLNVSASGKVCIQAFADARFQTATKKRLALKLQKRHGAPPVVQGTIPFQPGSPRSCQCTCPI